VFDLDEYLLALLAVGVVCGVWSVWQVRGTRDHKQTAWGRRVFLITFCGVGGGTLFATVCATRCLVPFGLVAGWLVIAMLWENPLRVWQDG
jgi:hypothetical protein